jgi:hypothetical protein
VIQDELKGLAIRLIESAIADSEQRAAREERRVREESTTHGGLGSRAVIALWTSLQAEVEFRALAIADAFIRVHQTDPAAAEAATSHDFEMLLRRLLPDAVAPVEERLRRFHQLIGIPIQLTLHESGEAAERKARNRFDLWLLSMQRGGTTTAARVFNFNAPVGAVQTGAYAQSAINQSADQGAREHLLAALDRLTEELGRAAVPLELPVMELSELAQEARLELQKPEPNRLRIAAVGGAIASSIQTVAALRGAYDLIRAALVHWGLPTPF